MLTKDFILGFLAGAIIIGIGALFVLKSERMEKYEMGKSHGSIDSFVEMYDLIKKEFGSTYETSEIKLLISKKATDIVVVEENGVKTIRAK